MGDGSSRRQLSSATWSEATKKKSGRPTEIGEKEESLILHVPTMPNNSTLIAIPAMWLTALWPHVYAVYLITSANNGRFDNANSKGHAFLESLQKTVPREVLAKYERCEAAHRNGLENLPLFAAAILAANFSGVSHTTVATGAWTYVAMRMLYNACYMSINSNRKSLVRTAVWWLSTMIPMGLLVSAATA